ncbi:MAG: SurA-like protein, partial [Brevibacterium sp.]|nr:SurA-like protein [Brevibacterium sp.]
MQKSKWLLGLALSVSVVAFAACGSPEDKPAEEKTSAAAEQGQGKDQAQSQNGKPNTDGIPDVVAEVNGEKITKDDFVPLYETQY